MQEAQSHEDESVNNDSFGCLVLVFFPILTISLFFALMSMAKKNGEHSYGGAIFAIWIIPPIVSTLIMYLVYSFMSARAASRKKARLEREAKERAQKEVELRERQAREEAERAAERARETAVRKACEKQNRLAEIARHITENSAAAVWNMECLRARLAKTNKNAKLAVIHYRDGVFSPFWSDIERAYKSLAESRESVIAIGNAADRHATLTENMLREGGDPIPYSCFPVALDEDKIRSFLSDAARDLESMTYEAQKNPVFAQIWEQRRLTSAVVSGFANLETAVRDMGWAVVESIESMGRNIIDSNARVEQAVETAKSDISLHLLDASKEQAEAMQRLIGKVGEVEREVYLQNWGHYSIL